MPLKSQNAFVRVITVSFFLAATSCADLSLRQSQVNPSDRVEGGDGSGENSVMLDSQGFPTALSPGIDSCRGFAWEPTIAVDPNNPMTVGQ